jgi:hypothetical protein
MCNEILGKDQASSLVGFYYHEKAAHPFQSEGGVATAGGDHAVSPHDKTRTQLSQG